MIVLSHEQDTNNLKSRASTITTSIKSITGQEQKDFADVNQIITDNEHRISDFNALYPRLIQIAENLQKVNQILFNVEKSMYSMVGRDNFFDQYSIGWNSK